MASPTTRVLITPLNWGLGHATRCIPIIHELQAMQCEVIIGANGAAAGLLQQEFPTLQHINTPGLTIRYGTTKIGFFFSLLWQLPALFRQLREERKWIQELVEEFQPQLIIADNRYGMYHEAVASVLITHQLGIKTGMGKLADQLLQQFLYRLIKRFSEVWVPDYPGAASLAGTLSHPHILPKVPVFYIGPLNRFAKFPTDEVTQNRKVDDSSLLILLSGPEPQRTILESILKKQLINYTGKVTLLRGLPEKARGHEAPAGAATPLPLYYGPQPIEILDHLPPKELFERIQQAHLVLCRSGYTSLMELLPLQKKLILIPTPGQPEQEYLAHYCKEKGVAVSGTQEKLVLRNLIDQANRHDYRHPAIDPTECTGLVHQRVRYYLRSLY